jgi:hypothetical protein
VLHSAESVEGLCWRPWPCSACRGVHTALGLFIGGSTASPIIQASSTPEEVAAQQIGQLQIWVSKCTHTPDAVVTLPKLDEGSEHRVFLDEADYRAKVIKLTRSGIYGEFYYLVDGLVNQKNCSPYEYLLRLRLWKKLFGAAPEDIGITANGEIVSRQDYITGTPPTQSEVDEFLENSGLTAVKRKCWLWKKDYPEGQFEIWVGDARFDNFVKTDQGIVPIDIRMWFGPVFGTLPTVPTGFFDV